MPALVSILLQNMVSVGLGDIWCEKGADNVYSAVEAITQALAGEIDPNWNIKVCASLC